MKWIMLADDALFKLILEVFYLFLRVMYIYACAHRLQQVRRKLPYLELRQRLSASEFVGFAFTWHYSPYYQHNNYDSSPTVLFYILTLQISDHLKI